MVPPQLDELLLSCGAPLDPLRSKQEIRSRSLTVRLTSKGQVTTPRLLRERYGLLPVTEVSFEAAAGGED